MTAEQDLSAVPYLLGAIGALAAALVYQSKRIEKYQDREAARADRLASIVEAAAKECDT